MIERWRAILGSRDKPQKLLEEKNEPRNVVRSLQHWAEDRKNGLTPEYQRRFLPSISGTVIQDYSQREVLLGGRLDWVHALLLASFSSRSSLVLVWGLSSSQSSFLVLSWQLSSSKQQLDLPEEDSDLPVPTPPKKLDRCVDTTSIC